MMCDLHIYVLGALRVFANVDVRITGASPSLFLSLSLLSKTLGSASHTEGQLPPWLLTLGPEWRALPDLLPVTGAVPSAPLKIPVSCFLGPLEDN